MWNWYCSWNFLIDCECIKRICIVYTYIVNNVESEYYTFRRYGGYYQGTSVH